jgi:hypothetical protein
MTAHSLICDSGFLGEAEFQTSDGDVRRLPAGSVVLAEDTSGKGHISRHPSEGQLVVHVALADHLRLARSSWMGEAPGSMTTEI